MKKKLFAAVLASVMVLSMTACGGSDNKQESTGDGTATESTESKGVKVIDVDLTNEEYAFGVDKNQPELQEQVNAFVKKIKEDGTLDEICNKYFADGEPTAVKSAQLDTSKDQLIVATNIQREKIITELIWKLQQCLLMNWARIWLSRIWILMPYVCL